MRHPIIRSIHSYWLELAAGRGMPNRVEIDPRRLGSALPDVFLLDTPENGASFRLAGSHIGTALGHDPTGLVFTEIFTDSARTNARAALSVAGQDGEPILIGIRALDPQEAQEEAPLYARPTSPGMLARNLSERRDQRRRSGEMILLPLFHKGRPGARILGAIAFAEPVRDRPALRQLLIISGTRVLGHSARPASPLGLVTGQEADAVLVRRGHLALLRGYGEAPKT